MRFCEDFRVIKLTLSLNVLQAVPIKHMYQYAMIYTDAYHIRELDLLSRKFILIILASYHKPFTFLLPEGPLNKQ